MLVSAFCTEASGTRFPTACVTKGVGVACVTGCIDAQVGLSILALFWLRHSKA